MSKTRGEMVQSIIKQLSYNSDKDNEEELLFLFDLLKSSPPYSSALETMAHIDLVNKMIVDFINILTGFYESDDLIYNKAMIWFVVRLINRGATHDASKLVSPEKEILDVITPKLWDLTYGSEEYKEVMKENKTFTDHHYKSNTHHPEHYDNGIEDFDLFDLIEMLLDWRAATKRHANGDIYKSIIHNKERFNMSDTLTMILLNTCELIENKLTKQKQCKYNLFDIVHMYITGISKESGDTLLSVFNVLEEHGLKISVENQLSKILCNTLTRNPC